MSAQLPRPAARDAEVADYERLLLALLRDAQGAAEARVDAADGGLLARILRLFNARAVERRLVLALRRKAIAGEAAARDAFRRQVAAYVSVRPRLGPELVATVLERAWPRATPRSVEKTRDEWITGNVRLVSSIGRRLHDELREEVEAATKRGARHEVLAKAIAERFEVARSRAKTIARDQVAKYQAQVNEAQQRRAGVDRYVWRHSTSRRNPRPEHVARDGKMFRWSEPPADGHPGHAVNCRCIAEPHLDDLLSAGTAEQRAP